MLQGSHAQRSGQQPHQSMQPARKLQVGEEQLACGSMAVWHVVAAACPRTQTVEQHAPNARGPLGTAAAVSLPKSSH
jgi:hypothetical protein